MNNKRGVFGITPEALLVMIVVVIIVGSLTFVIFSMYRLIVPPLDADVEASFDRTSEAIKEMLKEPTDYSYRIVPVFFGKHFYDVSILSTSQMNDNKVISAVKKLCKGDKCFCMYNEKYKNPVKCTDVGNYYTVKYMENIKGTKESNILVPLIYVGDCQIDVYSVFDIQENDYVATLLIQKFKREGNNYIVLAKYDGSTMELPRICMNAFGIKSEKNV